MNLNLFNVFFLLLLFLKHTWKIFRSTDLLFSLFGLDTYKHAQRKVVCIFLVNFSSKLPMKLEILRKIQEKCIFQWSSYLNLKNFYLGVYLGPTPRSHWTKQRVKKLNLWGNKAVDKSAWIKACMTLLFLKVVSATFLIVCF